MRPTWIPFLVVAALAPINFYFLLKKGEVFDLIAWTVFSAFWGWNAWAYWKKKNMLSYPGNFSYNDGKNELHRTIYVISLLVCYFMAFIWS